MATTQKKTGGSRASSGGSRAATNKKQPAKTAKSAASRSAGAQSKASQPQPKPFRRELGAVICLLLAVFSSFGYFNMEAVFITLFCELIKGLVGYGFWITPPCLLLGAFILAFHRGRPVRLRLSCALLLPVVFGGIVHGLAAAPLPWESMMVVDLWDGGEALRSGGVISGLLAQCCVTLFTRLGCTIVFVMAFILMGLGAFDRSIVDVADWVFNRPQYEPQEKSAPRPHKAEREKPASAAISAPRTRSKAHDIDIPMDDDPTPQPEPKNPQPKKTEEVSLGAILQKKTHSLFDRTAKVPAPDQVLTGGVPAEEPAVFRPEPISSVTNPEPQPPDPEVIAPVPAKPTEPKKITREEQARAAQEVSNDIQEALEGEDDKPYQYPPLSLLTEGTASIGGEALAELNTNKQRLSDTIHSFGIEANIVNVTRGPSVTRYELELDQGVRLNKLTNLADDIALALGASGVRIAPIPDQVSMVGIEVPNKLVSPVNIHEVIGSKAFTGSASKVSFALGKDIGGNCIVGNIAKLPHLLIAGTTGSGKSVCTNSLIVSLLYKATPDEVRLIMVDPKMVELGIYNGIPHLLIPVVTDPKKAAGALQWAVTEMMKRYRTFAEVGVRDLASYNAKAAKTEGMEKMPQVVVIIDELADLMLVAAKEVEESICRVAQMGRASGMHLVIATQRPSADVITGLMKANIPSRIAFAVASAMESRIILDTMGAEKQVGRGDMLFFPLGAGKPTRVQGCLISDQEVASVVEFVKRSGTAQYDDAVMSEIEQHAAEKEKGSKGVGGSAPEEAEGEYDELIDAAAEVIIETGQASVSMLQRRLKLGYARAARLVDQLEEKGIVGPFEGSKPRQLLITKEQWQEMKYRQGSASPVTVAEPAEALEDDLPPFDVDEAMDRAEEDSL